MHFGKKLGNQVKGHSPEFSNSGKFGRSGIGSFAKKSGKGSFTEKAKIVDRGSICSAPDSTLSKLQYEPFLFSVA